jgi:hypothetical protein
VLFDAAHDVDIVGWGVEGIFLAVYRNCVICAGEEEGIVDTSIIRYGIRCEEQNRYVGVRSICECFVDGPSIFCPGWARVENYTSGSVSLGKGIIFLLNDSLNIIREIV